MTPFLRNYYRYAIKFATIPRFICCIIFLGFAAFCYDGIPPTDHEITKRFKEKQQYYNRIRDMLEEDKNLSYLSQNDAKMVGAIDTIKIPSADISERRAQEYRDILNKTHSYYAFRRTFGPNYSESGLCLMEWRYGLGDTKYVIICWVLDNDTLSNNTTEIKTIKYISDSWYIIRN